MAAVNNFASRGFIGSGEFREKMKPGNDGFAPFKSAALENPASTPPKIRVPFV
jgi:hypothetical protein